MRIVQLALLIALNCVSGVAIAADIKVPPIIDAEALGNSEPCEDFYQFACGGWIKRAKIPQDRDYVTRQGSAAGELVDQFFDEYLRRISRRSYDELTSGEAKLKAYYGACLELNAQADRSLDLIKTRIEEIQSIQSPEDLVNEVVRLHGEDNSVLFSLKLDADPERSKYWIPHLAQGGLGLGERGPYFDTSDSGTEMRREYLKYLEELYRLVGVPASEAQGRIKKVLQFERALAQHAYALEDQNDPIKNFHPVQGRELEELSPEFPWRKYFELIGYEKGRINLQEPKYLESLSLLLAKSSWQVLRDYLSLQYLDGVAGEAGGELKKLYFRFRDQYVYGTKRPMPLWQECTQEIEIHLGDLLEGYYQDSLEQETLLAKGRQIVGRVTEALRENMMEHHRRGHSWMDDEVFRRSMAKLDRMKLKLGGPRNLRDYEGIIFRGGHHLENKQKILRWSAQERWRKLGQEIDPLEWFMASWEINAYNDVVSNEIAFPFGVLRPPAFDVNANEAVNFGAFGATVGHELTHSFDKGGSWYDENGNLNEWWNAETRAQFDRHAKCFVNQAKAYRMSEIDEVIRGEQIIDENLADQGGVKVAYRALDTLLKEQPEGPPWLGKFNERQQFWIAYAQSWCSKSTEQSLRDEIASGVHPPSEFRVNAVLMNRPEFARDFNCRAGQRMVAKKTCELW